MSKVLVVDLNNFARYPTVAVGYLVAEMRNSGLTVDLFSPLSVGVEGITREPPLRPWSLIDERLRYRSAISRNKTIRWVRNKLAARRLPSTRTATRRVLEHLEPQLAKKPDVILISAYLMYYDLCVGICRLAEARGIPVVIGGSYFNQPSVARAWLSIPGLTAIVGAEAEPIVSKLVEAVTSDDADCLVGMPGVWIPDAPDPRPAPPLAKLDALPFPDYSDFPWHRYPDRIIPILSGRGCGWGACTFCSDVTSSMGRTFRSRSPADVLNELQFQAERFSSSRFIFVDLKLNSDLDLWNGLIDGFAHRVAGAQWAASVHIGTRSGNGLSLERLTAARAAGLVRLTTGFESASQHVLDEMKKGTDAKTTSQFLRDANEADISVRMTMIVGYPNERAADLLETAEFLTKHSHLIERISLNRLAIIAGTPLDRQTKKRPDRNPDLVDLVPNDRMGTIQHRNRAVETREHRRAIDRVLTAVHKINRRPLREGAQAFSGVM